MFKTISILAILCFFNLQAKAQLSAVRGKAAYPFWLNLPSDSVMKTKPPVLIFLHGKSLSGSNLELVKKYGVIHEMIKGRQINAIVVAPQVPAGSNWEPDKLLEVLNYIQKTYATDTARVYVTGMSLGGYGTLHFAGKYPDRVTAAVALCGGGNSKDACNLSGIPLWVQHGTADRAVPISESNKIVNAIRQFDGGPLLTYTVLNGWDHGDLERLFRTDELYDWLFSHSKALAEQETVKQTAPVTPAPATAAPTRK
jgi:predicted peptidase